MPPSTPPALLVQLATTLPLVGLIWTIQLVHYPLFDRVGAEAFARYHADHARLITPLVGPLMVVELMAAMTTVRWPSARVPEGFGLAMLALVAVA